MKTVELHFPNQGVNRRLAERRNKQRGSYPAPWAVNVRLDDPIDRRLRGGSGPGLTKYSTSDFGTAIADMVSVDTSSTSGAEETLLVLVDSLVKTGTGGTLTALDGFLENEAGGNITADDGVTEITVSSASAPSSGFIVSGQQKTFVVNASAVAKIDPKSGQIDNLAPSGGVVPTNQTFGAVYRDRLILAGEDNSINASAQGDHSDWDFGKDVGNTGRAIMFQLSHSADVGPLPTAMVAHKDRHLLLASVRTLWVLQGDPATGQLRQISENVGIISEKAWCRIEDSICFLSETGVYQVAADGSKLSPLSEESLPVELRAIDTSTTTVLMGYEHDRKAIHIYLVTAGGSDTHWVYELLGGIWWPMRLQDDHSPLAVVQHEGKLLLGGNDGYVREIGGDDDDGTPIESHVILGPMRMGRIDRAGIMNMLHGILADGSGAVVWRVVIGSTAEEAADDAKLAIEAFQAGNDYSSYVQANDTWNAGRSLAQYPRVSSLWACLWLQSTAKWSFEGATMQLKLSGRYR